MILTDSSVSDENFIVLRNLFEDCQKADVNQNKIKENQKNLKDVQNTK
jgi:hypothetical protein